MTASRMGAVTDLIYGRIRSVYTHLHLRYISDVLFVHIKRTGGTSITEALGLPHHHWTATELRRKVGHERWRDCFTFSFVRNPWDRMVSLYFFRRRSDKTGIRSSGIAFPDWIREVFRRKNPRYRDDGRSFLSQTKYLTDESGGLLVDYVGRFERLREDVRGVAERAGIGGVELPHLRPTDRPDYRKVYDDASRDLVGEHFAEDIDRFGYSFR